MEPAYRMTDAIILRNTFVNVCNWVCCNAMAWKSVGDFGAKRLFSWHSAILQSLFSHCSEDWNAVAIVKTDTKKPLPPDGGKAAQVNF
jgi:hypothetical protein